MNKKRLLTAILAVCLAFTFPYSLSAAGSGEIQDQLDEKDGLVNEAQNELDRVSGQKNALMREIEEKDAEIQALDAEVSFITAELLRTEEELLGAEKDLEDATKSREEQMKNLIARLRVLEAQGEMSYLEILLGSSDLEDFLNRLENVESIAKYDREMFEKLSETEGRINDVYIQIDLQKKEIEQMLLMKERVLADQNRALDEKQVMFARLSDDEEAALAYLEQERLDQAELQELLKKAQTEEAAARRRAEAEEAAKAAAKAKQQAAAKTQNQTYSGGKFAWPVPGYSRISSPYGNRTGPISGRPEFHSGIDIPAPRGTPIIATADGVVIRSDWFSGYGNCVIIDHGSGYSTLYGHASQLLVSVGQSVTAGETIAKVGTTGNSTGNHLHYEIRIGGSHTNPISYLGG